MPRPKTKSELIAVNDEKFTELMALVNSIPANHLESEFPFEDRDRNIRDVLTHLHEWHLMMEKWYTEGMAGEKPIMPAPGYTWRTLPDLNKVIWKKYQETSLTNAIKKLNESHLRMMELINKHDNDELFTKKYYRWTKTTSLGTYFIANTSSHYEWAMKKIKRFKKELEKEEVENGKI
ncbi:ClbS/DfsB family four-helix bundle protein [Oceanobacillus sp. 143]|uniref:ClbS/DfsB family four-helix bundle protein n=1 Tax=Oceanobacillus zhaokaii TaxID=2052660 RepID=A0A345PEC3_9BACI|nr:ClbS/DfsB family four-helix bundle protein [Oceanobacillus zhaokaii]AXI08353.1 hypothetical protein CUC15_05155 [Oceanobacillus zhaokaii]QGS68258.1 ClbS/DfsB family four-helix bundle protein [Oceanobacillus sp. 143]